ncbi:hypothetical protein [Cohnella silvisoli]|uniref:Uncharacterized protein n=1 Tax=Cohnella silvisoli TaxID=2873699 RepID=A0ABV1L3G4_9BACL|nr:hypothetical protein [Cohnella silvisoli]MCD9026476.1 hypothetical protein [Cohnella silvisoli]
MGYKKEFSRLAGFMVQEFATLSEKFAVAVKEGANRSSEKILEAVDEFVEPSSVLVEKLSTAVKEGENKRILEAVKGLIQPSSALVHKFTDAVKDGANFVGGKMMTTVDDFVHLIKTYKASKE